MFEEVIGGAGVAAADRLAIQEILVRYSTGIDWKQWGLFKTLWTDDAQLTYAALSDGAEDLVFHGAEEITRGVEALHARITGSLHRLTNFDILTYDGERASCRTYGNTVLVSEGAEGGEVFHITGYYHDEIARGAGGDWRIATRYWGTVWRDGNVNVLSD